ncbi:MAG TPA: hypothetical protein VFH27_04900 [Longimicrobiaceae bacterium]|nr:hypothetical protein [Longimicrobiaceae bacterium]
MPLRRPFALLFLACAAIRPPAAAAQVLVTSGTVVEHTAAPGASWSGTIRLHNAGARAQDAGAYLADYAFQADGATRYTPSGSSPRSSGAWITLSPARVTVPAGGDATIAYTVRVPAGRPLTGTYWSMVMVQGLDDAGDAAARSGGRVRMGIRPTIRYGVQLATTVAGTGTARAAFTSPRAEAGAGGHRTLHFDVVNDGETAYRPAVRLELFDAEGNARGRWEAKRGLLYPGSSLHQAFDLGALPAGAYQALVVADAGGESVFGARYRLTL